MAYLGTKIEAAVQFPKPSAPFLGGGAPQGGVSESNNEHAGEIQ